MDQQETRYKAVIFDLDGTLINSLHDIADSMNRVLSAFDYPTHDYESYRFFVGKGLKILVQQTLPEPARTEENILKLYLALLNDYKKNCLRKTELYPGIAALLTELSNRNLRMAILSNKADAIAKDIASDLLSGWSFAEVLGFTDEIPRKPDPSGAFQISSKMGVLPENILYVGDTNVDMQTARAAGMFPVGVSWGFRTREELLNHGATLVIDHPLELLTLLN